MPHELRTFNDDGVTLSYEVFGKGDRVLVYLHGILLDSFQIGRASCRERV